MDKTSNPRLPIMVIIMLGIMTTFWSFNDRYVCAIASKCTKCFWHNGFTSTTHSFICNDWSCSWTIYLRTTIRRLWSQKVALIIISLYVIASLIAVFTTSLSILLTLRLIQGLTGGGVIVIAKASIGDQHKGKALAKGLASLLVVNGIISIIAPLIGGYALTIANWKAIFLILTIISFAILLFAF